MLVYIGGFFMVNHVSFCGILGKTTRNIFLGSGIDHTKITQDYYPFKNEFRSQTQQDEFIKQFPDTKEGQKLQEQSPNISQIQLIMKEELPFTKAEYEKDRYLTNKDCPVQKFLKENDDLFTTTTTVKGFGADTGRVI